MDHSANTNFTWCEVWICLSNIFIYNRVHLMLTKIVIISECTSFLAWLIFWTIILHSKFTITRTCLFSSVMLKLCIMHMAYIQIYAPCTGQIYVYMPCVQGIYTYMPCIQGITGHIYVYMPCIQGIYMYICPVLRAYFHKML